MGKLFKPKSGAEYLIKILTLKNNSSKDHYRHGKKITVL